MVLRPSMPSQEGSFAERAQKTVDAYVDAEGVPRFLMSPPTVPNSISPNSKKLSVLGSGVEETVIVVATVSSKFTLLRLTKLYSICTANTPSFGGRLIGPPGSPKIKREPPPGGFATRPHADGSLMAGGATIKKQASIVGGATAFIRPLVKAQESPRVSDTLNGVIKSGPLCVPQKLSALKLN